MYDNGFSRESIRLITFANFTYEGRRDSTRERRGTRSINRIQPPFLRSLLAVNELFASTFRGKKTREEGRSRNLLARLRTISWNDGFRIFSGRPGSLPSEGRSRLAFMHRNGTALNKPNNLSSTFTGPPSAIDLAFHQCQGKPRFRVVTL